MSIKETIYNINDRTPAVIEVCRALEKKGFRISYIPVDEFGMIQLDQLEAAITSQTILIRSCMPITKSGPFSPFPK
jgi:cysteine desulfurase